MEVSIVKMYGQHLKVYFLRVTAVLKATIKMITMWGTH
jgi:hypothetical protein